MNVKLTVENNSVEIESSNGMKFKVMERCDGTVTLEASSGIVSKLLVKPLASNVVEIETY